MSILSNFVRALFITVFVLSIFFTDIGHIDADTSNMSVEVIVTECSDGSDNDGDSLIDYPDDPDCTSYTDDTETALYECSDGIDNDSDGFVDYPDDIGCSSSSDSDEYNVTVGRGGGRRSSRVSTSLTDASATVVFTGYAYPGRTVTLLKDVVIDSTTVAGADAGFEMHVSGLSTGAYTFILYTEDANGRRSSLLTFPMKVTSAAITRVSDIFIAPTIDVNMSEIRKGGSIVISGQSAPLSDITIVVEDDMSMKVSTDSTGAYSYNLDTSAVKLGTYSVKARSAYSSQIISGFSKSVEFVVGTQNVDKELSDEEFVGRCPNGGVITGGDLSCDNRINLVDFFIAVYWHKKASPPVGVDVNADGKVDLVDFSIMAYYWTG